MGIETEVLKERYGSVSAKYVTRAAISPLFPISYMEKAGVDVGNPAEPTSKCLARGKGGVPLSACSKCKRAKYCSTELSGDELENAQKELCTDVSVEPQ
ncbi:hypothetical protein EV401DRAFT_1982863 [Pisolithus croceorrhizus]|nr:hypothetical protein EV401DRAFT_1982863 [Pisolithus croceorrhizus]